MHAASEMSGENDASAGPRGAGLDDAAGSKKLLTQCLAEETPESRGGWKQVRHATPSALCMGRGEHGIPTKLLKTLQFPASVPINPFTSWARIRKPESRRVF